MRTFWTKVSADSVALGGGGGSGGGGGGGGENHASACKVGKCLVASIAIGARGYLERGGGGGGGGGKAGGVSGRSTCSFSWILSV